MPVTLSSVAPIAPNKVRFSFSGAMLNDYHLAEKSNYSFSTRLGFDVPLYAAAVTVNSSTQVDVTLVDAMLDGGHYQAAVTGLLDATGADVNSQLAFEGVGLPSWCFILRRHAPSWWATNFGSNFAALLNATGIELDKLFGTGPNSAYTAVQQAMWLRTAAGPDLAVIAQNYGVRRPDFATDDTTFRKLIPLLATQRKCALKIFYDMLTALVGPQASTGWAIYEIEPNKITIEIPSALLAGITASVQDSSTYLHADATITSASTFPGDYLVTDETHSDLDVGTNAVILFQGIVGIASAIDAIKASGIAYTLYTP